MADISMGAQIGYDTIVGLFVTVGGLIMRSVREDQKTIEGEHKSFKDEVHREFARKDDMRDAVTDLKVVLRRIEDKLDRRNP